MLIYSLLATNNLVGILLGEPEYIDPLREALFTAGALDVQVWSTQSKKGRSGFRLEATVSPGSADRVVEALGG